MSIPGLGASPELPEQSRRTSEFDKPQVPDNNSIWAEFNDQNEIVDNTDVKYKEGAKKDKGIADFLNKHAGQTWTDSLKLQIKQLITRYNMQCKADALFSGMGSFGDSDPFGSYEAAKAAALDEFREFGINANNDYNKFSEQAMQEFDGFTKDADGAMMNFKADAIKEQRQFVKDSTNEILNDLRNGYNGYVNFAGYGTITYDAQEGGFVMTYQDGSRELLDDAGLEEKIEEALNRGANMTGRAYKYVVR